LSHFYCFTDCSEVHTSDENVSGTPFVGIDNDGRISRVIENVDLGALQTIASPFDPVMVSNFAGNHIFTLHQQRQFALWESVKRSGNTLNPSEHSPYDHSAW
jgi:hypothetical protein